MLTPNEYPGSRPLIEVRNVNFWFDEMQALDDVNLDVYQGEILAFIGPSGCGKTTMLKCFSLMHLVFPT